MSTNSTLCVLMIVQRSILLSSAYPRPTADARPCEDRSLVLTCLVSGLHNDRRSHFIWIDGNGPIDNSDQYSMTGDQLMIANVNALSGGEDKAIRCCEVLNNGIVVTGEVYMVEPLGMYCVLLDYNLCTFSVLLLQTMFLLFISHVFKT